MIHPARILIADDEAPMRELLASALRRCGYPDIAHASSGKQAHDMLAEPGARFDLVLLDLEMPGFSGIEVLSLCAGLHPHCMFVMVSGHSALANVMAALAAGAHGFVVKPYNMAKIEEMLANFTRRKKS